MSSERRCTQFIFESHCRLYRAVSQHANFSIRYYVRRVFVIIRYYRAAWTVNPNEYTVSWERLFDIKGLKATSNLDAQYLILLRQHEFLKIYTAIISSQTMRCILIPHIFTVFFVLNSNASIIAIYFWMIIETFYNKL